MTTTHNAATLFGLAKEQNLAATRTIRNTLSDSQHLSYDMEACLEDAWRHDIDRTWLERIEPCLDGSGPKSLEGIRGDLQNAIDTWLAASSWPGTFPLAARRAEVTREQLEGMLKFVLLLIGVAS